VENIEYADNNVITPPPANIELKLGIPIKVMLGRAA